MIYKVYLKCKSSRYELVEAMSYEESIKFLNFFYIFNLPGMGEIKYNVRSYRSDDVSKIQSIDPNNLEQIRQLREKKLLRLKNNSFFKKLFKFTWLKK